MKDYVDQIGVGIGSSSSGSDAAGGGEPGFDDGKGEDEAAREAALLAELEAAIGKETEKTGDGMAVDDGGLPDKASATQSNANWV